jgi:PAS domain S-box-containing protein
MPPVYSHHKTILLVEDEPITALRETKVLEKDGYHVHQAKTGEDAVRQAFTCPDVDLILMDIDLGEGIDGTEAARQILEKKDIPVVFLSSHTEPEVVDKTEKITSYGYVVKESGNVVLLASIRMAFRLFNEKMNVRQHEMELAATNEEMEAANEELEVSNEELIQSQHEIAISEQRFRDLFNSMKNGVAIYEAVDDGEDFVFRDMNRAALEIEQVERQDVIGKSVCEAFPGVKDFGLFDVLQRVWRTGKPESHPVTMYRDERITGWRDNDIYRLPSGEVVAVYEDLTGKKILEQELFQSQSILMAAIENSQAGIAVADAPKGKLRFVNRAGLLIGGGDERELVENIDINAYVSSWKIHYPDGTPYNPEDVPLARAVLKGESVREEFIIRRKDGDRHILAHAGPVRDGSGNLIAGIVVFLDITEQKDLEQRLSREKELNEHIMNISPTAITILDKEGNITYANIKAEEILGIETTDGLSYNTPEFRITDYEGNDFPDEELPFNIIQSTGKPVSDVRHAIETTRGRRVFLSINAVPLNDRIGTFEGMVASLHDISDQVTNMQGMKEINNRLEERIKELDCLHQLGRLVELHDKAEDFLPEFVDVIRRSWKYPEIAAVRISTGKSEYQTDNFRETPFKQAADFRLPERKKGTVEVYYLEKKPEEDDGPFLQEERQLLDTISERLGRILEREHLAQQNKINEESLRYSEERFRSIFENAPLGIALVDPEGRPVLTNGALQEMLGYSGEEFSSMAFTEFTHPDDATRDMDQYRELFVGNIDHYSMEKKFFHKNGAIIEGQLTVTGFTKDRDDLEYAIAMVREKPS